MMALELTHVGVDPMQNQGEENYQPHVPERPLKVSDTLLLTIAIASNVCFITSLVFLAISVSGEKRTGEIFHNTTLVGVQVTEPASTSAVTYICLPLIWNVLLALGTFLALISWNKCTFLIGHLSSILSTCVLFVFVRVSSSLEYTQGWFEVERISSYLECHEPLIPVVNYSPGVVELHGCISVVPTSIGDSQNYCCLEMTNTREVDNLPIILKTTAIFASLLFLIQLFFMYRRSPIGYWDNFCCFACNCCRRAVLSQR